MIKDESKFSFYPLIAKYTLSTPTKKNPLQIIDSQGICCTQTRTIFNINKYSQLLFKYTKNQYFAIFQKAHKCNREY